MGCGTSINADGEPVTDGSQSNMKPAENPQNGGIPNGDITHEESPKHNGNKEANINSPTKVTQNGSTNPVKKQKSTNNSPTGKPPSKFI